MRIEFYKSALCPRCAYASHVLKKLQAEFDDIEIVSFDIATDFKAFKDANIRMIPTIKHQDSSRSWLLPKASEIRDFVLQNRCSNERPASQNE